MPSTKHRGTYIIDIGGDNLFALTVDAYNLNEVAEPFNSDHTPARCMSSDAVTEVKLILNQNLNDLASREKYKLVEKLGDQLLLTPSHIVLSSKQNADPRAKELPDAASTLISGPGDNGEELLVTDTDNYLSWIVGCGAVKAHQMEILERLEAQARDGSLSRAIGRPIGGWQVTIRKPKLSNGRRLKRNVRATSTPSPVTGKSVPHSSSPESYTPPASLISSLVTHVITY